MHATTKNNENTNISTVTTEGLQNLLNCGRPTAIEIGTKAQARIQIGRRVLWNVEKVNRYLELISE